METKGKKRTVVKDSTVTKVEKPKSADNKRFRISGAWKNEAKDGSTYLAASITPEQVEETIKNLEQYKSTGCKIMTFTNSFREEDKHPHFIHYICEFRKEGA